MGDDDDDVGIPFLLNKPKLKSAGFVSSVSSLIFKDFNTTPKNFTFKLESEKTEKKEKNDSAETKEIEVKIGVKRARETAIEDDLNENVVEKKDVQSKKAKLEPTKAKIEFSPEKTIPSSSKPKKFQKIKLLIF